MSNARRLGLALALALSPGALAALAMSGCDRAPSPGGRQAQEQPSEGGKSATLRREGPGPDEVARDFAAKRREFRAQTERDLAELDRSIDALERDVAAASGEAKRELEASLVKAREARRAVKENLEVADTVLEATWDSFKAKVRKHLGEARVSVETRPTGP
ncbi:MAG TPA: hypothetical protein VFS43_32085 [Polyangiaceae bacterium]|nr:hypothetical protein [Polyangiaceae bacterium]